MPLTNPRILPFSIAASNGMLTSASQIAVDSANNILAGDGDDAQQVLLSLKSDINNLVSGAILSGRNFERINTDLVIDNTNVSEYAERIILYGAGINKVVDWTLPTSADITNGGESFPYVFETIHLGARARVPGVGLDNRVRISTASGDATRIVTSGGLQNLTRTDMLRGDRIIWVKETSGSDWFADYMVHDSSTFVLPSGVMELRTTEIDDVANIATILGPLSINRGDAFVVTDADGGEYFGRNISNGDIIMALVDTPGVTTNDNEDWTVLDASQSPVPNDLLVLSRNAQLTGSRLDFSRNVFVDEANVISFSSSASNTPASALAYFDANGDGIPESRSFANQPLQFSDLQGGTLSLAISFATSEQSGFLPELTDIEFDYGGGNVFTFPLTNVDPSGGIATVDITIPSEDYSSILNTNCTVTLNFVFRGARFVGTFTIVSLVNTLDGTLRQSVTGIANTAALMAEQRLTTTINGLAADIDTDEGALRAIEPRISPFKTITTNTPETSALFLDSSGVDGFPSDLSTMSEVEASNPRFTGGSTALFVAVPGGRGDYTLRNITTSSDLALDDAEATVNLGESVLFNGGSYFVYRVTGLTSGHVYEVERVSNEQVVAWPDDIRNLNDDVLRIDAELEHAALNLPSAVVDILDNNTSVTEEATPNTAATAYNIGLAGSGNATQTVFYEPSENAGSSGTKQSRPLSELSGDQVQRKLLYIPDTATFANQLSYVTAFDGSTSRDLISYQDGTFSANVFVPAQASGSTTSTLYPAPSNRVAGEGVWQTIEALTFQNGVPVPEANELFFTRSIPGSSVTLNIQYRGHANGNIFGASSTTLAGVGGASEVATTFVLDDGSETVTAEVRWYPSRREIRVSEVSRVNSGLPTINDIQVILSYTETRTVPATPATTRQVAIETLHDGWQVFAFRPATSGNLAIVGDRTEIDTGYSYATLFGAGLTGHIAVAEETARFLNFEDFTPIHTTVADLENHATLPQLGLFSTTYTHETVLAFDVALRSENSQGDTVNLGEELVLVAPDNSRWRLSVDNAGDLETTEVT